MSAPRPYRPDPFYPLGSITNIKQFLYIYKSVPGTSPMWYVQVRTCNNCACALAEKLRLWSRWSHFVFPTVMLMCIDTTFMEQLFRNKGFKRRLKWSLKTPFLRGQISFGKNNKRYRIKVVKIMKPHQHFRFQYVHNLLFAYPQMQILSYFSDIWCFFKLLFVVLYLRGIRNLQMKALFSLVFFSTSIVRSWSFGQCRLSKQIPRALNCHEKIKKK